MKITVLQTGVLVVVDAFCLFVCFNRKSVLNFAVILVNLRPKIKAVRNDEKIPHINKRQAPNKYQVQINPRSTRSSFK